MSHITLVVGTAKPFTGTLTSSGTHLIQSNLPLGCLVVRLTIKPEHTHTYFAPSYIWFSHCEARKYVCIRSPGNRVRATYLFVVKRLNAELVCGQAP